MKYLPIFNKGDKVNVNNKYIGLKSMVGEIYTIRAGPARCSDTWCYWLENVAGGIAADALEPLEQTNEEMFEQCRNVAHEPMTNEQWFCQLSTEEKARLLVSNKLFFRMLDYDGFVEWLKQPHKE